MSGITTGTALIAAATIGAASSLYAADRQASAQKKAAEAQRLASEEAKRREEEMLAQQKALDAQQKYGGASAETVSFGTGSKDKVNASYNSFLIPKTSNSQLGTSGKSGLGFAI